MDFEAARRIAQRRLDDLYAGERERPIARAYGWDTGDAWAPSIFWDGIMGAYIWLVDKQTGALTPRDFYEFIDMPDPKSVGPWPQERE
jgi:hypothetical protein